MSDIQKIWSELKGWVDAVDVTLNYEESLTVALAEKNTTLTKQLEELEKELQLEREVVDFYADIDSWYRDPISNSEYKVILLNDIGKIEEKYFGGKRARQRQAKRKLLAEYLLNFTTWQGYYITI